MKENIFVIFKQQIIETETFYLISLENNFPLPVLLEKEKSRFHADIRLFLLILLIFFYRWKANESEESLKDYIHLLNSSDLTLCPAGFNTETYRVYEAISAGSIPVIEDTPSKGNCDPVNGWRLLKKYNPPVIWVKNWTRDLGEILEKEKR